MADNYDHQFPSLALATSLSKRTGHSSTASAGNGNNNMKKKNKYRSISLTDLTTTTTTTNYGKPALAAGDSRPRDLLAARVLAYESKSPSLPPPPPPPPSVVTIIEAVLPDKEVEAMDGPWKQLFSKPASSDKVVSFPAQKEVSETSMAIEETVQVSNECSETSMEDIVVDEIEDVDVLETSHEISETSMVKIGVDEVEKVMEASNEVSETSLVVEVVETHIEIPKISVENTFTSNEEYEHLSKKLEEEAVQLVREQKLEELKQQLVELEASAVPVREAIRKLEKEEI